MFWLFLLVTPLVCGDRIVHTNNGPIIGTSLEEKKVEAFLGIPYAEPPIGPLRFAKPTAKSPWKDIYEATDLPNACVQAIFGLLAPDHRKMSEDCLYLNIWVPENGSDLKPIMVFIHGGAFMFGSSNFKIYDGATLAERGDVIVATINYRVGTLGFFSGFIEEAAGNMGMYDQIMAIQWIRNNAKHFGGDSDNIVLYGHSAGAFSVSLHMVSPLSKNIFRRGILQSGTAFHPMYSDKNEQLFMSSQAIAKMLGCANEEKSIRNDPKSVVDCMKAIPMKTFSDTDLNFFRSGGIFIPRVGDDFLPENPIDLFRKGEFKNTELLLGVNKNEGSSLLTLQRPDIFGYFGEKVDANSFNDTSARELLHSMIKIAGGRKAIESYLDRVKRESRYTFLEALVDAVGDFLITCSAVYQADYYSLKKNKVYFYLFDYRSASSLRAEWMGVTHFDEIPYVFGNPFHKDFTESDKELSSDIMDMWIAFAKIGNPNISGNMKWPSYTYEDPKYFTIGQKDRVGVRPDNYRCERWRDFFRSAITNDTLQTFKNSAVH